LRPASWPDIFEGNAVKKERLDILLSMRGLAATRSRARDLIKRGLVRVDGVVAGKPAQMISQTVSLDVTGDANRFVSRGAEKLIKALEVFGFDADGRIGLDVGASTGGFTQVLLERGASHVWCVDVGQGQLSEGIKENPRVSNLEGTDARSLSSKLIAEPVSVIVADVSFISLTKALPAALKLAAPGCWLIALVKPQFEAGPDAVGKGGVVRDEAVRARTVESVRDWMECQPGWAVTGVTRSPIEGGDGNIEFLIGAEYGA
jgi:23S rRNA (cytidine1920-2'-O)/16S rRNA (cytidine1409-2'-O)-methyltransferase